jgi:acetoin utilization deacetylase AcuC-like enzyme
VLIVSGLSDEAGHARTGHPERPERIGAVRAALEELHLGSDLRILPPREADTFELARVHTEEYLNRLETFCRGGGGNLDPDTFATTESWGAAIQGAGAGLAAVEALRDEGSGVAFIAARPPGHHALSERAMGFCLLNNVAVSAAALTDLGERVLVVDWDVHHGNGTQAIFWDDPDVLYVSTHQWPLYPGTGSAGEIGGPDGAGQTVNIPMPAGATGDVLLHAFDEIALPVIEEFRPSWALVSAGFDAHRADPLADLAWSSGDFAALANVVSGCVPTGGRLALFLEGGYDLEALQMSVAATLGTLLGVPYRPEPVTSGGPGEESLPRLRAERVEGMALASDA